MKILINKQTAQPASFYTMNNQIIDWYHPVFSHWIVKGRAEGGKLIEIMLPMLTMEEILCIMYGEKAWDNMPESFKYDVVMFDQLRGGVGFYEGKPSIIREEIEVYYQGKKYESIKQKP